MNLVQRLLITDFLKLFGVVAVILSLALSSMELVDDLHKLMTNDPSALDLLKLALYGAPRHFLNLMPMVGLVAALFVVGQAARNRELIVISASGGRLQRLFVPFVLMGLLMSIVGFIVSETVIPPLTQSALELRHAITKAPMPVAHFKEGILWMRTPGGDIVKGLYYLNDEQRFVSGIRVFDFHDGALKRILYAYQAKYASGKGWELGSVLDYDLVTGRMQYSPTGLYKDLEGPEFFSERIRKAFEMSFIELWQYLDKLKGVGFKNPKFEVELHYKLSYPLMALVMVVLGVSVAARRGVGGVTAAAFGVLLSGLYWFGYTMMLTFSYAGMLPPIVAVWSMPLAFGLAAWALYRKIPE